MREQGASLPPCLRWDRLTASLLWSVYMCRVYDDSLSINELKARLLTFIKVGPFTGQSGLIC